MNLEFPEFSRSRAILIGTAAYQDKEFPQLPAAANSLKGLREILVDAQLCGWPDDRVTALLNSTDVRRLVTKLRRWARDTEDVLLVYYVGHGTITPRGELCLALSDTEFDDPDITGIEYERIRSALLDSPARIKVVILDCCYSGRAIQALANPADVADITDIRGAYIITASDHAAHVPPLPQQTKACTSFTGELLDLIRTGVPGGPDVITLNTLYCHLRKRLHKCDLPEPNQRGTDTAGEFGFTRNAAFLPGPIDRFPRPEPSPAARMPLRKLVTLAAATVVLAGAAAYATARFGTQTAQADPSPCATTQPILAPASAKGKVVVVGSGDFTESALIGQIYADALNAKRIPVTTEFCISSREIYYQEILSGQVTVVPEYNGALLTTEVDAKSTAVTEDEVDTALTADLPSSLEILDPSSAQDRDSLTVTQATAAKYHLSSIADLSRIPGLVIGGPSEFQSREQGLIGLEDKYNLVPTSFLPLDDSGIATIDALTNGTVQAADVFTTDPVIKADNLKVLPDPRHMFTAANIVPLVYKPGVNATVIDTLNAVSAKLTQTALSAMDTETQLEKEPIATVATDWLRQVGLGSLGAGVLSHRTLCLNSSYVG